MQTQHVGRVRIDRVVESEGPFAALDFILPDADAELLARHGHWLRPRFVDPQDRAVMSFHSLIVRTPRYTILVDSCVGNDKPRPLRPGWHRQDKPFLADLAQQGLRPEDIDFVLCTHLHADHVGWNTRLVDGRWVPTFANARYIFARREYDYWAAAVARHQGGEPLNHGSFEDSVLPVIEAGQALLVDDDHQLDRSVWLAPAPGHTPGNVVVHIDDGDARALLTGDVFHSAAQLARPELSSRFCSDPALSRATRTALIERYADTDTLILPAHFPTPTAGKIRAAREGFRFAC